MRSHVWKLEPSQKRLGRLDQKWTCAYCGTIVMTSLGNYPFGLHGKTFKRSSFRNDCSLALIDKVLSE